MEAGKFLKEIRLEKNLSLRQTAYKVGFLHIDEYSDLYVIG